MGNPLAGGLLSGKYTYAMQEKPKGRFEGNSWAKAYQDRYWKKEYFDGIDLVNAALTSSYKGEVGLLEASLRWIYNHSMLIEDDAVILGFSKMEHYDTNYTATKKGPLTPEVVQAFEEVRNLLASKCPAYNR